MVILKIYLPSGLNKISLQSTESDLIMSTTLCLDFGNTRLKWAIFSEGRNTVIPVFCGEMAWRICENCLEII